MSAAVIHMFEFEHPCALCGVMTRVEFLERHDAYGSTVCEDCFSAAEAELHARSCVCRYCVARRAVAQARKLLAQRRAREAELQRLRDIGAVVGEGDEEDISW